MSYSDLICYLTIFIVQMKHPSLLNIVMPILVLLWGTLSNPRPSKTFWVFTIAYIQTVIILKIVFQLEYFWRSDATVLSEAITFRNLLGVGIESSAINYDLGLLILLFFHRYILKCFGLWRSEVSLDVVPDGCYQLSHVDSETRELIEYQRRYLCLL